MASSTSTSQLAWLLLFMMSVSLAAPSGDRKPRKDNTAWRTECNSCHFGFDPALLPADDWQNIMSNLDKHFGADASLDDKTRMEIQEFLVSNGSRSGVFVSSTEAPRITRKDWFLRKHRGAIRLLQRGKVKTLVACPACHKDQDIEMKSRE